MPELKNTHDQEPFTLSDPSVYELAVPHRRRVEAIGDRLHDEALIQRFLGAVGLSTTAESDYILGDAGFWNAAERSA